MNKFLTSLFIYLLVFFPQGQIPIINVRYKEIFIIILLIIFTFCLIKNVNHFKMHLNTIIVLIFWTIVFMLMSLNGLQNNNPSENVLSELIAFSIIWLSVPLSLITLQTPFFLVKHFIIASTLVAITCLLCLLSASLGFIKDWNDVNDFLVTYGIGSFLPSQDFYRLFLKANFYIMICACIVFYFYMKTKNKKMLLSFFICMLATFFSGTRGLVLPMLLFIIVTFFVTSSKKTRAYVVIFTLFISLFSIIILTQMDILNSSNIVIRGINPFYEDGGNSTKMQQITLVLQEISKHLITGSGLGVNYDQLGRESSLEVVYFDLLNKMGIIGFGVFIFTIFVYPIIKVINKGLQKKNIYLFLVFWISLFITLGTNPYIVSSLGMLIIAIVYSFFLLEYQTKEKVVNTFDGEYIDGNILPKHSIPNKTIKES